MFVGHSSLRNVTDEIRLLTWKPTEQLCSLTMLPTRRTTLARIKLSISLRIAFELKMVCRPAQSRFFWISDRINLSNVHRTMQICSLAHFGCNVESKLCADESARNRRDDILDFVGTVSRMRWGVQRCVPRITECKVADNARSYVDFHNADGVYLFYLFIYLCWQCAYRRMSDKMS